MQSIKKILEAHKDGATLDPKTLKPHSPKSGYAVSITDNPIKNITQKEEAQIKKLISQINALASKINLSQSAYFIGYWLDQKTSTGYLDITIIVKSKTTALQLAKIHDQKAIFNFKTLQSIYLK